MIVSAGQAVDFAPQALGETVPSLSNGWFYARTGLDLSGRFATYAALYRTQPTVATVVDKISASAARLTLKVWDNSPATGKVEDLTSPFARLIARPSLEMAPFSFWRWTFATYEVYGEAFWFKVRDDTGRVVALLPMHPTRTTVERDEDGNVVYIFNVGVASAGLLKAKAEDVVPFLRYNPESLMRGMSRLEPLRPTLLNDDAARRATQAWWRNGARPSVFLKHPDTLSEGAHERIRKGIEAAHGGADNMGKAAVLEEGMDAQVVQLSAEEMQYIESRKLNMQEVCMAFDVPPPVVHILDHATFSNITEQMRSMYRDTMAPRLEDVESVINFYLRPDFYPEASHTAAFALDEVLRGDFETRATAVGNLIEKAVMKPSEARPLFDLPDAGEIANRLYGNAALVPLGSSVHGQEEVLPTGEIVQAPMPLGTPKPKPEESLGSEPAAPGGTTPAKRLDLRSIGSKVGRKASLRDKRAALVEEHQRALGGYFDAQRADVKADTKAAIDTSTWDDDLAALLADLGHATAKAIGAAVARSLGGTTYDAADIADWIHENALTSAKAINATTVANLKSYLDANADDPDAVDGYFDGQVQARTASISASRVAMVGGLASLSSASQQGAATKTWNTGPNPRADHAAMNGETVGIDEVFSNGMNAPGDPAGGADEVAGCNCDLTYDIP
jgi:HK97 family phage portal protein